MGMDAYLVRARNKKQLEQPGFWDKCIDLRSYDAWEADDYSQPAELWYGRKNWELHQEVFPNYGMDENGTWVEVDKDTLEKMVDAITHRPDYFGGFETAANLCQALFSYDEARENGWSYFYESDW